MKKLSTLIAKLEEISDPDINRIEINRDRVGNWRVIIDELFSGLTADERDKHLEKAIIKCLESYCKQKMKRMIK